jgi:uncharacterized protein
MFFSARGPDQLPRLHSVQLVKLRFLFWILCVKSSTNRASSCTQCEEPAIPLYVSGQQLRSTLPCELLSFICERIRAAVAPPAALLVDSARFSVTIFCFAEFCLKRHTHIRAIHRMKRPVPILIACVACLVLCVAGITRADDIKKIQPTGYVTDLAGVIQPQTKTQLEALCLELQQKTGAQMAIITVKSLDGSDIETYSSDLYKQLGIGSKKSSEGVLLLVAPNDRKYRVEVGYGAEPVINDARAGDAGRLMVPFFRSGDYSGGITAAAWQLAKNIADDKGVTLSGAPQVRPVRQEDNELGGAAIWILLGIILLIFLLSRSGGSGSNINRRGGGSGWWIGPMMGGGWGGRSGGGGGGWGGGGGGFGGFGGGMSGGGGASGSW